MQLEDVPAWGKVARLALPAVMLGLLLSGCSDDDDDKGGGGGGSAIVVHAVPGFGTFYWRADGGSAVGQAGRSGGTGGNLQFQATGGVGPDDGRPRPTPAVNFLTNTELADNLVTYTELTALQAPVLAAGEANFTLPAGTGLHLPAGATLDFSDAPAGVADRVLIISDDIIRVSGSLLTTRAAADAVDLELISTRIGGPCVMLEGNATGTGAAGFSGGDLLLSASFGTVMSFGNVNLGGGAATAVLDAGSGGSMFVSAGQDLLIPYGSFSTVGGSGDNLGGDGGQVLLSAGYSMGAQHRWGARTDGGNGALGDGGDAGDYISTLGGHAETAVRYSGTGGSTTGAGALAGFGGSLEVSVADATGIVYGEADGGDVITGAARLGGWLTFGGYYGKDVELRGTSNGGIGPEGGPGGTAAMHFSICEGGLLAAEANGGNGVDIGGIGGQVFITGYQGSDLNVELARIEGSARGGHATGLAAIGGDGGEVLLGYSVSMAPVNATAVEVRGEVQGGDAPDGEAGRGGTIGCMGVAVSASGILVRGNANGGTSSTSQGGQGGQIRLFAPQHAQFDAVIDAEARGGEATTTGFGGTGGTLEVHASGANGSYGAARVRVSADVSGGNAVSGPGGQGGTVLFSNIGGGSFALEDSAINARGGSSQTGDGGNASFLNASFDGPASFIGGYINTSGGDGATAGGNGNGGHGADNMDFFQTEFPLILDLELINNGGSAGGTGNAGGGDNDIRFNLDSDFDLSRGSIELRGRLECRGGDARGSGAGGQGGEPEIAEAFNVLVEADIDCSAGNSVAGAGGSAIIATFQAFNTLVFRGAVTANGGNGATTGGAAGTVVLGADVAIEVLMERTADIRANGGTGATGGAGGTIELDPSGTGGALNTALREEPGVSYQVLGGATGGAAGTIVRD